MKNYYKFPLVAVLSLTTACGLFASGTEYETPMGEASLRSTVTLDEILTTPECRERALACAAQSGKGTQAAYYFDAYFKKRYEEGKGVQDESYDFNETAFLALNNLESGLDESLGTTYLALCGWLMRSQNQGLPFQYLESILQGFRLFHEGDLVTEAALLLCNHPDFAALCQEDPKKAALYRSLSDAYGEAFDLYEGVWRRDRSQFIYADLCNAMYAFSRFLDEDTTKEKLEVAASMFSCYLQNELRENGRYDEADQYYLESALSIYYQIADFVKLREIFDQLRLLGEELNNHALYLYAGYAYSAARDHETACDYWSLLFQDTAFKHPAALETAINDFLKIRDFDKARELLERFKALTPPTRSLFIKTATYYSILKDHKNATLCADEALRMSQGDAGVVKEPKELCDVALLYSRSGQTAKSTPIWKRMREAGQMVLNDSKESNGFFCAYFNAVNDYYAMGDFKSASDCLEEWAQAVRRDPRLVPGYQKMNLGKALTCHIEAHEDARALEFIKANSAALEKYVPRKSKDARPVQRGASTTRMSIADLAPQIRLDLARDALTQMGELAKEVCGTQEPELKAFRDQVIRAYQRAKNLHNQVSDVGAGGAVTSTATSSSQETSSPSSSSQSQDPLFALQRLVDETKAHKLEFDHQKMTLDLERRHQQMREMFEAFMAEEADAEYIDSLGPDIQPPAPSMIDYKRAPKQGKVKTRGKAGKPGHKKTTSKAASPASSSSSSSSSSSASSSSSSSSGPSSSVQGASSLGFRLPTSTRQGQTLRWRITRTAQKQLEEIRRADGLGDKLKSYCYEIGDFPWARKGHGSLHASGHAKLLQGYDNLFSRRFTNGKRFFYRVEKQDDGSIHVTILGLTKHDLLV